MSQLTTTKSELNAAINMTAAIARQKTTLPILNHILIKTEGGNLTAIGSNLDIQVTAKAVISDTAAAFNVAVPAERLQKILASLDDGDKLTFTESDAKLTVKAGRSKFSMATLPPSDFPLNIETGEAKPFELDQAVLREKLATVFKSAAKADIRYYLNGVLFEVSDGMIHLVATDGFRVSVISLPCDAEPMSIIVSRDAVAQLIKLFGTGPVSIANYGNRIEFVSPDFTFTTKPVDGKFPDWRRVVPAMNGGTSVDRETILTAFNRAAVGIDRMPRTVSVSVKSGVMAVTGGTGANEASDSIDIQLPDVECGVNVDYMTDAITSFSEHFNLLIDGGRLCFWHDDLKVVVMTMRA